MDLPVVVMKGNGIGEFLQELSEMLHHAHNTTNSPLAWQALSDSASPRPRVQDRNVCLSGECKQKQLEQADIGTCEWR